MSPKRPNYEFQNWHIKNVSCKNIYVIENLLFFVTANTLPNQPNQQHPSIRHFFYLAQPTHLIRTIGLIRSQSITAVDHLQILLYKTTPTLHLSIPSSTWVSLGVSCVTHQTLVFIAQSQFLRSCMADRNFFWFLGFFKCRFCRFNFDGGEGDWFYTGKKSFNSAVNFIR